MLLRCFAAFASILHGQMITIRFILLMKNSNMGEKLLQMIRILAF